MDDTLHAHCYIFNEYICQMKFYEIGMHVTAHLTLSLPSPSKKIFLSAEHVLLINRLLG